jgi:hypothetical protein
VALSYQDSGFATSGQVNIGGLVVGRGAKGGATGGTDSGGSNTLLIAGAVAVVIVLLLFMRKR